MRFKYFRIYVYLSWNLVSKHTDFKRFWEDTVSMKVQELKLCNDYPEILASHVWIL